MNTYIRSGSYEQRAKEAAQAAILLMAKLERDLSPKPKKILAHGFNITVKQLEKAIEMELVA